MYQVSNLGRVKSLDRMVIRHNRPDYLLAGKVLKQHDNGKGYMTISLCVDGKPKTTYVHRLVAEAFIPNPNNLPEVNHKDENPENNNVSNLEWCSGKYNKNYGNRAIKYSVSRGKPVVCVETGTVYHAAREAMRQTGINATDITACCTGYRNMKIAGGYHWKYADKT